jgi:hypothetical protein
VSDDGLPSGTLTTVWSKVSGPGTVTFGDPGVVDTTATFSAEGTYVLRLSADDTELSASDEVTVSAIGAGGPFTLERPIATGSDDAEERVSNGSVNLTSGDLELTTDGTAVQTVGLRFTGVAVPPGSTITSAWVQFRVDEATTAAASLTVAAQAADDASTFTTATANVSLRPRTAASVGWVPPAWPTVGAAGPDQRTPDLSPVIQQVVDRAGWASGNALAIIITGTGKRTAEAFEGAGGTLLHLEYATGPVSNRAPTVSAGADQSVVLPASASLDGTVSDDGLPSGTLTTVWSKVSGPGTVTFGDPGVVDTTATFSAEGTYVLRLSADDTELSASDEVTVSVTTASATPVDGVHYTFTGPTSVAFDWRGGANDIRYGPTSAYGTTVIAQTPNPLPWSSPGPYWEAHLFGLQPATTYHYSIGGGADGTFTTAPTGTCRFDAEGDISSTLDGSEVGVVQANIAADDPDFVLGLGDLSYADVVERAAVDQHFNDMMVWSRTAAYMPTWGNHEWQDPVDDDLRNYMGRFAIPNGQLSAGTPTPAGEDWGWFEACGIRFVSYPEPYSSATWSEWGAAVGPVMAAAQADPSVRFIVTFGHRPAYSSGNGSSELASILDGLGDAYPKYVLDLNGHVHIYERFEPIHGVTHITSGGGGRGVGSVSGTDPQTAFIAGRLHHLRVDVTSTGMLIQAICGPSTSGDTFSCTPGQVFDSITIGSGGNGAPSVSAGPDQTVVLPADAVLDGTVTDDGMPSGTLQTTWSKVSGPGTVSFADPGAVDTTATVSEAGTYVLRLTATDTDLTSWDEVTVNALGSGGTFTIAVPVTSSSDDAEEGLSGVVDLSSSDLELVVDGSFAQTVGMRFPGVSIPAGSTIVSAYVQFQVDEATSTATSLTVAGQAADNAPTFAATTGNVSSRPRTSAAVAWVPAAWPTVGAAGPDQRTPDLSAVIQEIVDRAGWASGNAIAIVVTGSGRRTAESADGPGEAPVLSVTYLVP